MQRNTEIDLAMQERRFGRLNIQRRAVFDAPEQVFAVLSQCLVLKTENYFIDDVFIYDVCCPAFEPVALNQQIPVYQAEINVKADDDGNITDIDVKFTK